MLRKKRSKREKAMMHQPSLLDNPPPTTAPILSLRPYQEEALTAIVAAQARGVRRPLIVLPTGGGKTVVFCHLARRLGVRTLILAHRKEEIA
jgi:superfamily II DNA or RNA helicase